MRRLAAVVVAIIAVWVLPGSLPATLVPEPAAPHAPASRTADRGDLDAVGAALTSKSGVEEVLDGHVRKLGEEIARLRAERAAHDADLSANAERTRTIERELDHLVPRLQARRLEIDGRRKGTARALASLAGLGRQVEIEPTVRARLLAVSPLLMDRWRKAGSALAALETRHDGLMAEKAELAGDAERLIADRQRLESERDRAERQQAAVQTRLAAVQADLNEIGGRHRLLAERLAIEDAALELRLEAQFDEVPWYGRTAPGPAPSDDGDAAVVGHKATLPALSQRALADALRLEGTDLPSGSALPRGHIGTEAVAVAAARPGLSAAPAAKLGAESPAAGPEMRTLEGATALAGRALSRTAAVQGTKAIATPREDSRTTGAGVRTAALFPPPPAKPVRREGRLSPDNGGLGNSLGVDARSTPGAHPQTVLQARLDPPDQPILPVPGEIQSAQGDQPPQLTILAQPGQAVAAPTSGRVLWAGVFRSYGPLLIIEHEDEYHTLLWGLSRLDVERGEQLRIGQIVGVMPQGGAAPKLTIELRQNGHPVDPMVWLAESSSKVRS